MVPLEKTPYIQLKQQSIKQMKNGWYVCVVSHVRRSLVVGQVSFGHQPPEPKLRSIIKKKKKKIQKKKKCIKKKVGRITLHYNN